MKLFEVRAKFAEVWIEAFIVGGVGAGTMLREDLSTGVSPMGRTKRSP